MDNYINTLGQITDYRNIVADDIEKIIQESGSGALVKCIHQEDGVLQVQTRCGTVFYVSQNDYESHGIPKFYIGDLVHDINKNRDGIIEEVFYHFKNACFYYLVSFLGKKSGKWYFDQELEKMK